MRTNIPDRFNQITEWSTLYNAAHAARKGTRTNDQTLNYMRNLEKHTTELQAQLRAGTWQPGAYHHFYVYEPKERLVQVAPFIDRVVHHAIVDTLTCDYEPCFYEHSYACRKGKGSHRAVWYAQKGIQRYKWFLKTDIHKFFESIQHQVLMKILRKKLNYEQIDTLLQRIFHAGGLGKPVGLPIGNLTSQFFANVYLNELDQFIKRNLRCKMYVRYMDDFVLFCDSFEQLNYWFSSIKEFLATYLHLSINTTATMLNRSQYGLTFCGARIWSNCIQVRKATLRRIRKKQALRTWQYALGKINEQTWLASTASQIGHIRHCCHSERREESEHKA